MTGTAPKVEVRAPRTPQRCPANRDLRLGALVLARRFVLGCLGLFLRLFLFEDGEQFLLLRLRKILLGLGEHLPQGGAHAIEVAGNRDVEAGDRVRIDGWLVQVNAPDGWRWRSSLTREDSGGGACEVVYVCSITRE